MFKNYLKVTLRSLRRDRAYSFTNVLGLAVGFACCLLIVMYVQHERSFDQFNTKADRIFRVEFDVTGTRGSSRWKVSPVPTTALLKSQLPEIEAVVRVGPEAEPLIQKDELSFYEDYLFKSEPELFEIFDFPILSGSASGLARPNTIVISESIANKYFADSDPIGQTLSKTGKWSQALVEYEVVGVMADPPSNSHFRPNLVASAITDVTKDETDWRRILYSYVLLKEGVDSAALTQDRFAAVNEAMAVDMNAEVKTSLVPLGRIHLYGSNEADIQPQGDIRYIWIFSAIAALILLIACINYMNLATARATRRAKEVGVRKVVGAHRGQLMIQFVGEAVVQALLGVGVGLALTFLALPSFNRLMDQPLALDLTDPRLIALLGATALAIGVLAGLYPAVVMARQRSGSMLKGDAIIRSSSKLRKSLVVLQFAISAALIAFTIVIQQQLNFVQDKRLGFDADQVVVISARNTLGSNVEPFKEALQQQPGVQSVTLASGIPGHGYGISFYGANEIEQYDGEEEQEIVFDWLSVDEDFIETFKVSLLAGRNLTSELADDADRSLLINETAVRDFGWASPEVAIGRTIGSGEQAKTIVGVIRDFHMLSMKEKIRPMILGMREQTVYHVAVKLATPELPRSLAAMREVWDRFAPGQPMAYSFLDDDFAAMYRAESRLGQLFTAFAILGIFVACLGLFGLAAYTAEQRTKEIGIRKVLGASVPGLVAMLSAELIKLVLLAIVVALPLVYVLSNKWLQGFVYHVDVSWQLFAISTLIALSIAISTVAFQAIKAAIADPVSSLRYE